MHRRLSSLAAIVGLLAPAIAEGGEILNIGDPAPPLAVSAWVKGTKVDRFEPGKVYVVDFWATSCVECTNTIPHLSELARKFKDQGVRFIGVSVGEGDARGVAPFLDAMGRRMDYSVALDDVPAGAKAKNGAVYRDGAMARAWLRAAEEHGIPITFVVRDGKIAWIGHPSNVDQPLARIAAGDGDFADLAGTRLAEKAAERQMMAIQARVYGPYQAGDYRATLAAIAELTADNPVLADTLAQVRFSAASGAGDVDVALAAGSRLFELYQDDGQSLNNVFFYAVDLNLKTDPDPRIAQLALKALRRANELTGGGDMAIVDSLAVALFRTGHFVAAAIAEAKALELLQQQAPNRSHPYYKTFEGQLIRFRKAAVEKAKAGP